MVDASGVLAALSAGMTVLPAGCRAPECAVTWDGSSALQMDQLTLTFKIKAGVLWSDGTPVTAEIRSIHLILQLTRLRRPIRV